MAYAMSTLVAMFLCMALVVVHVDSARLLLQAGNDAMGMIAKTSATTVDSAAQGTPPAAGEAVEFQAASAFDTNTDAIVSNKDAVTTDPTTAEFAAQSYDLTKQALTVESGDEGTSVPPTDVSFAQEDSVPPGTLYNLNADFPSSFASKDQGTLVGDDQRTLGSHSQDSFASADQGFLVGDSQRTMRPDATDSFPSADWGFLAADTPGDAGSDNYNYKFDATRRDGTYPADSNAGASEFALAEANPQLRSDESGNPSTADEPQFEFEQDNTP